MQKSVLIALSGALILSSSVQASQTTPVQYTFFSAAIGGGKVDSDNLLGRDDVTVSDLNLQWLVTEHYLVNFQYKGRFTHFDDENDRADYLTLSGARRFGLTDDLDLVAGIKIGGSKIKLRNSQGSTVFSEKDFLLGVFAGLNYGLTESWELRASLEYLDYDVIYESSFELGTDYYIFDNFSLGLYGRTTWNDDSDLTQGGVVAKFSF